LEAPFAMRTNNKLGFGGRNAGRLATLVFALTVLLFAAPCAHAEDDDAKAILKAMSDYVASQTTISLTFDTDIEAITPELEKIQFTNSGRLSLSRPDKLVTSRTGGYADVELVFDGKTFSALGKNINAYTQIDAPGTVDQLIERLRAGFGLALPAADLLLSHPYDELIADVIEAKHVGSGVIDGIECEHLAFRNPETDWQLWVEIGEHPIPRKYVITSKTVTGAPQYTLRIKDWKSGEQPAADAFAFTPPQGATKVGPEALSSLDELPPGVAAGASQ
jgi:hypothetical protein